MSIEERLQSTFGPARDLEPVPDESLETYQSRLPNELLSIWKTLGWCSFAGGGVWFVDPDLYAAVLEDWLPEWHSSSTPPPLVFARSGVGDLLVLRDGEVGQLSVHYGRYVNLESSLRIFLKYHLDEEYESIALEGALTRKAVARLGPLARDEMFTFVPSLALGGEKTLATMQKVEIWPQLALLAQLFEAVSVE